MRGLSESESKEFRKCQRLRLRCSVKAAVTAEHLKCGSSKSRCAVSAKCMLSFKDLVPKRIKYLDFFNIDLHFNFGHIGLNKIY